MKCVVSAKNRPRVSTAFIQTQPYALTCPSETTSAPPVPQNPLEHSALQGACNALLRDEQCSKILFLIEAVFKKFFYCPQIVWSFTFWMCDKAGIVCKEL